MKGEFVFKKNLSELPQDFFVNKDELVICNLIFYNLDNPIKAVLNKMLVSCLGTQNLSTQNKSQIYTDMSCADPKNQYKNMSEILITWESYLEKIDLTIPFKIEN
jgi:hypothetical protein